jgi:prolyl oligopeptidase
MTLSLAAMAQTTDDPYLWLEDVLGDKPLAWVRSRNAESQPLIEGRPEFKPIHERLLGIYNSRERIPAVVKRGKWLYNFWQDAANPRGLWRRTTLDEYRKKEPAWETVIDVDKLDADEKQPWVWGGADCLYPDYARCLVRLAPGGSDAAEVREFDTVSKAFVKDGFNVPLAKSDTAWRDRDTVYVATDFGAGSLTTSGYPRIVKEWKRGTPLAAAKTVLEGKASDVSVSAGVYNEKGRRYEMAVDAVSFFEKDSYLRVGDEWKRLDVPRDADVGFGNGYLFLQLKKDWAPASAGVASTYKAGALIAQKLDAFLDGKRAFDVIFEPREGVALQAFGVTRGYVVLDILDHVKSRITEVRMLDGVWIQRQVPVPESAAIGIAPVDHDENDDYWMTMTSFTQPTTLYLASAGRPEREPLKSLPAFFDAKGLVTEQFEATSKDGTKIPYFVVHRKDAKFDGANPTILYGYGGFEISMTPNYSGTIGSAWLERGGVYALANIRGGGEFGPEWHLTARREGRHKAHDDFIAVAEDLIARKVTSPRHLGIVGGSQGGLLVGAAFTQRPDLYRAVVCQVPLLDMRRFNKLLAGASWMDEYGDPDKPEDWAFISKYSPYQNVVKDKKYPKILFVTSTRDDRVHPGHARKMVAKMREQGHDVLYYENIEGGHAAASTPTQQAYMWALTYTFLWNELR